VIGMSNAAWRAELRPDGSEAACGLAQGVQTFSNGVQIAVTARADRSNDWLGVYFILHLPADRFAGGRFVAGGVSHRMPETRAHLYRLGYVPGGRLELCAARDGARILLETPTNITLLVQDNRAWSDEFAVLVPLFSEPLPAGQPRQAALRVSGLGQTRAPWAEVQVDTHRTLYRFEGFGGNYCYGMQGAMPRVVYGTLRPLWARALLRPNDLRRPPAGADAHADFLRQYAALDRPDTELRATLEMQAIFATNRTPYFLALWQAPAWMYTDGRAQQERNRLRPEEWPRLAAAVSAYLRYARDQYGAEPEAFALNEPDGGACILVPPSAYPAAMRALAAELQRAGVRTRLVLGDVANAHEEARGYLRPILADPALLRQAAWLSFHAWGGAAADEYAEWAALADRLRLPLVVAEAGVDPDWRRAAVFRHDYAMQEMALYFALLNHARPQVVLLWEHSDDYPVLGRDAGGHFVSTARWGMQRQWIRYTPRDSQAVACDVLAGERLDACAFAHGADRGGFTLHLGNRLGPRTCRIGRLPAALTALRAVQTTREQHAQPLGEVEPQRGELRLDLPAESLTTLTTLPTR
jgi:hypothetical protein